MTINPRLNKSGCELLDNPLDWGRKLIQTHDHDPLYTALWRYCRTGNIDRVRRFLLAYWCCYSVGASWWMSGASDSPQFWDRLNVAAENSTEPKDWGFPVGSEWPRGRERRGWQGDNCIKSVCWLRQQYPDPEDPVRELEALPAPTDLHAVEQVVTRWPLFGPWIAFKAADMLERVLGARVSFPNSVTTLYKSSRQGAEMAAPFLGGRSTRQVTDYLINSLQTVKAPPSGDRPVNVQEVETVLCKWRSARNGKYFIGSDIFAHRNELTCWGGQDLLAFYPNVPT